MLIKHQAPVSRGFLFMRGWVDLDMEIFSRVISKFRFRILLIPIFFISCSNSDIDKDLSPISGYKYLAMGDSYTQGEGVCDSCSFPKQLLDSLNKGQVNNLTLLSIAQTGWTTTDLINGVVDINPPNVYDLVTLLIGVNNQFRRIPFSVYEEEFPILLEKAIILGKNDRNKVIVISIPDYSYTPIGQYYTTPEIVSDEISQYNDFASIKCQQENVYFQDITDISKLGLEQPDLVASDDLHLSEVAYSKIVERIFNKASSILQ